mmetsp:Transcript_38392/g.120889  ORF Transcript_38392/g.120889 Transcript_38392/m.120889 type:complete len:681 (+) Transcript_38392:852-2894(+)
MNKLSKFHWNFLLFSLTFVFSIQEFYVLMLSHSRVIPLDKKCFINRLCCTSTTSKTKCKVYNLFSPDNILRLELEVRKIPVPCSELIHFWIQRKGKIHQTGVVGISVDKALCMFKMHILEESKTSDWIPISGPVKRYHSSYNELHLLFLSSTFNVTHTIRMYNDVIAQSSSVGFFRQNTLQRTSAMPFVFLDFTTWDATSTKALVDGGDETGIFPCNINTKCNMTKYWSRTHQMTPFTIANNEIALLLTEACNTEFRNIKLRMKGDTLSKGLRAEFHGGMQDSKYPWVVIMLCRSFKSLAQISNSESWHLGNLCENPNKMINYSFVKPGKVIRDMSLSTEGSVSIIRNLARQSGTRYILFDAGWYGSEYDSNSDPLRPTPFPRGLALNITYVVQYASMYNMGVFVYVNDIALLRAAFKIFQTVSKWGVVGVKFGFVKMGSNSDMRRITGYIQECAKRGLMVNVHDNYREYGISRSYPNIISSEGVCGDEHKHISPEYVLLLPYTRIHAGWMDFTYTSEWIRLSNRSMSLMFQLSSAFAFHNGLLHIFWYLHPSAMTHRGDGLIVSLYKELPDTWMRSEILLAEPMRSYAIARQDKQGRWFIAVLVAQETQKVEIHLGKFCSNRTFSVTMYEDTIESHQGLANVPNNRWPAIISSRLSCNATSVVQLQMHRGSGLLIVLRP